MLRKYRTYLVPDKPTKITLVILGIAAVLFIVGWIIYSYTMKPLQLRSEQQQFIVQEGQSTEEIAQALLDQGFIRSIPMFRLVVKVREHNLIQAGGFLISKSMNLWEIVGVITKPVSLVWVTIQPGLRKEEIAQVLGKALHWTELQKQEWNGLDTVDRAEYIEGVYFPDTYLIPKNETPDQSVVRLRSRFQTVFAPYAVEAANQNIKWTTVITLASIIQREGLGSKDMPIIAGVLWNRLEKEMKLQIDATVQYARGNKGKGWWAPISASDIRTIDSRYNTYKYEGLPPHPISNPSLIAIKAVLEPATTTCLYYLHDNNHQIHCAPTYKQHVVNINRYLR